MALHFQTNDLEDIILSEVAIGEGAAGRVYEVIQSTQYQGYVAKIYKDRVGSQTLYEKITYLIHNRPRLKDEYSVIFPERLIYQNGQFVGYLMKKAPGAQNLNALCSLNLPSRLGSDWQHSFSRKTPEGQRNRLKLCYNIAAAINQIHRTRKYTFIDIKPENIRVGLDGRVSIVDVDSIAISDGYELLFPAEKFTQEYSPREYDDVNFKQDLIDETWDRFSISIIFYKILFGIHPYAGTTKGSFAHLNTNEQKIKEGLFPLGKQKENFEVIPEPHKKFKTAPRKVRQLFLNTLDQGQFLPAQRASAEDWCKALKKPMWKAKLRNSILPAKKKKAQNKTSPQKKTGRQVKVSSTSGLWPTMLVFAFFGVFGYIAAKKAQDYQMRKMYEDYGDVEKARLTEFEKRALLIDDNDMVTISSGNVTWVMRNDKFALAHLDGRYLTKFIYDWARKFKEELAAVRINGKQGFVDKEGQIQIPLEFDYVSDFHGGVALVKQDNAFYFINKKGLKLKGYKKVGRFYEGLATFNKEGLWGFLNQEGKEVIPANYDFAYPFQEGRAVVNYYGKYGYVDQQGREVIPPQFDRAHSFSNGKAWVKKDGKEYWINLNGERSLAP